MLQTAQHSRVQYSIVHYDTTWCSTVQLSALQHCAVPVQRNNVYHGTGRDGILLNIVQHSTSQHTIAQYVTEQHILV